MAVQFSVVNAPNLYIDDLRFSYIVQNVLVISGGAARNSSNLNDISIPVHAIVDGDVSGVINGLDQGSLAANTLYCLYVIGDSSLKKLSGGLLSLDVTTPIIPGGYDMYRRIGWVRTDGSANILPFRQYGRERTRTMWYETDLSVLTNGTATSFTSVDLSSALPFTQTNVIMNLVYTPLSAANIAEFLPPGSTSATGIVKFGCGVVAVQQGQVIIPCATLQDIQYKVASGDTLSLSVAGYYYYL